MVKERRTCRCRNAKDKSKDYHHHWSYISIWRGQHKDQVSQVSRAFKETKGGIWWLGCCWKGKSGTVTGHYFNFIAMTLDVMDKHELFKERYLVVDNAPIHKHTYIRSYIESRGYGCVYLSPYSPELNPIEQFWSVCKSKLKREALLEEETLTSRIKVACNNVLISDLHGFCKYSVTKSSDCLKKDPSNKDKYLVHLGYHHLCQFNFHFCSKTFSICVSI
jgi:transposase